MYQRIVTAIAILSLLLAAAMGAMYHRADKLAYEATAAAMAWESNAKAANAEAKALREIRQADLDAIAKRDRKAQSLNKSNKERNDATQDALKASPDWADQPIPDGVLDAISGRTAR